MTSTFIFEFYIFRWKKSSIFMDLKGKFCTLPKKNQIYKPSLYIDLMGGMKFFGKNNPQSNYHKGGTMGHLTLICNSDVPSS